MKRIISILVGVVCTVTLLHAQDIIVTKNAQRIEANIIELSTDSVKYLDPSNPDGPASVLRADEISSVLFQSGQVKLYEEISNNYLARSGRTYYYNDKELRGREYEQFLRKNCATAFNEYHSGKNAVLAGWVLLGYGIAGGIGFGVLLFGYESRYSGNYSSEYEKEIHNIALSFEIAGFVSATASTIASIPCLCVGYTKMHRSVELFNFSCAHKQQAYWSVNASQNGVGLAYNF